MFLDSYTLLDSRLRGNDRLFTKPSRVNELEKAVFSRKRTGAEPEETRDHMNNLIDYANAPVIVWNPDKKITLFSHAFEYLTDYYAADEVTGQNIHLLFPEEKCRKDRKDQCSNKVPSVARY